MLHIWMLQPLVIHVLVALACCIHVNKDFLPLSAVYQLGIKCNSGKGRHAQLRVPALLKES